MPTITAAIITFNEERNIQRCLDSLKNCVDDILVLDSFSTDNTLAICKENNVRVIQHDWMGYSKSKNYLNTFITSDLIFSIDADESLSEELQAEINSLRSTGALAFYAVNRITNYCGTWIKHSG